MAGGNPKLGETLQSTEPPQQSQIENLEMDAKVPNPTEVAKVDIETMRKKLDVERKSKQERADFLKKAATERRDKESWINQPMVTPTFPPEGMVRNAINSSVEDEIKQYLPLLEQSGIGDFANLGTVKQAVKEIIYEHYCKTGLNQDTTTNYAKNELLPKFKSLLDNIQRIFQTKIYPFKNQLAVIEAFSSFTKLDFCTNELLNPEKFKEFATLDGSAQDFLIKTFEQQLYVQGELSTLAGQETNMELSAKTTAPAETTATSADNTQTGAPTEAKPEIAKLLESGTLKLSSKVRFSIPEKWTDFGPEPIRSLSAALPKSLEAANEETVINYLLTELKKLNPAAGETFELAENGKWQKVDVKTEQEAITAARQKAEKAATEATAKGDGTQEMLKGIINIFEGDNVLGKIITFILGLFGMKGLGAIGETQEFTGLDMTERPLAEAMKKTMEELKLNAKTIHTLLINPEATKKILKQASDEATATNTPLDWSKYFEKHLNTNDLAELRPEKEIKVEDIAKMILTPNDEPNQPPAPAEAVAVNPQPTEPTAPEAPPETPAAAA
jgi:hypothetical protein